MIDEGTIKIKSFTAHLYEPMQQWQKFDNQIHCNAKNMLHFMIKSSSDECAMHKRLHVRIVALLRNFNYVIKFANNVNSFLGF